MQQKYSGQKWTVNSDCGNNPMRLEHVTSACPMLAKEKHVKGHDRVCAELHFNLLKTKRNLFYIRNRFVPRSKHFTPRLQKPVS